MEERSNEENYYFYSIVMISFLVIFQKLTISFFSTEMIAFLSRELKKREISFVRFDGLLQSVSPLKKKSDVNVCFF